MPVVHLPATTAGFADANAFLEGWLDEQACSPRVRMALATVLEEVFMNIVHYSGAPEATLHVEREGDTAVLRFEDTGAPFDPLAKPDPDTTLSAADRPIGGLGILMVKRLTDSVTYARENDANVLTVRKTMG